MYSTSVQKVKVKNFISFSPPTSISPDIVVLLIYVKGIWLSLHIRFVNTVLLSTLRLHDYIMHKVKLVQDEHLYIFFCRKWPIILLGKNLIPRLGSCRAALKLQFKRLFKCTIWRKMFSSKTLISFRLKKERHEHLGWQGWANYQEMFILEVNTFLKYEFWLRFF